MFGGGGKERASGVGSILCVSKGKTQEVFPRQLSSHCVLSWSSLYATMPLVSLCVSSFFLYGDHSDGIKAHSNDLILT